MSNNDLLNIQQPVRFDESITEFEYHSFAPYASSSLSNSDELRIPVQNSDALILPSQSFIYVEGRLDKNDDTSAKLISNAIAFLFQDVKYEIAGYTVDETRNVGITSSIKNYVSLPKSQLECSSNFGWGDADSFTDGIGNFNACLPLSKILGFADDYKKPILNCKHELILIRAISDGNSFITTDAAKGKNVEITLSKVLWKIPVLKLSDEYKLSMMRIINSGTIIYMPFRSYNLNELPSLQEGSTNFVWSVRSSSQLEKARWILFALQTERHGNILKNASQFDHVSISSLQIQLNSVKYPYEPLRMDWSKNQFAEAYEAYSRFQSSYYHDRTQDEPLLNRKNFKELAPIFVINCQNQVESIESGSVELQIHFSLSTPAPKGTRAYALVIHDRIVQYSPLFQTINKV